MSTLGTSGFGDFSHCFVDRERAVPGGVVPAGYLAQDIDLLLLDDEGRPAPAGEAGEIAVRGRYGAAGYWKRPDLTAAQFGPVDADGCRVYRTGDWAGSPLTAASSTSGGGTSRSRSTATASTARRSRPRCWRTRRSAPPASSAARRRKAGRDSSRTSWPGRVGLPP